MSEPYRPQIHMTPNKGWMNDPNGLVYFAGLYHQFYQYNPSSTVWDAMHWGHKTSHNLIDWQEHPPALFPDKSGMCFSGSAIVDWHNTSGLFEKNKPGLLAFYTSFLQSKMTLADGTEVENPIQQQSLAYSQDGINWTKYNEGAAIIKARGNPDFRDPKVIWHEPTQVWVMVVACGQHIEFYRSTDLLNWCLVSEFGYRHGAHSKGPWECPDLFELNFEGSNESRWILLVGIGEGAHCGGAGTQYFIGDFDGETFTNHNHPNTVLWLDFGRDYYATQSFSDIPTTDGRRIVSTWMSNHQYSLTLPTLEFRGVMAIPRELFLFESQSGLRVGQRFITELNQILHPDTQKRLLNEEREVSIYSQQDVMKLSTQVSLLSSQILRLELYQDGCALFEFSRSKQGIKVRSVRQGQCGSACFDEHFPHDYQVLLPISHNFQLDVLMDKGSVELLINNGEFSFTNLVYAENTQASVTLSVDHGTLTSHEILASHEIQVFSLK